MAEVEAHAGMNYTILRFNFSEDIMTRIGYFAKLHQFEDRQTYKTNWNRWWEDNQTVLEAEIRRLETNGYEGDVNEKMYKAGRYYFRKKGQVQIQVQRSKYTTMNKTILEHMDSHIITSMRQNRDFTPASGYTEFCERYAPLLVVEMERLKLTERLADDVISSKIKKTYKNRYFMMTR